MRSHHILGLAAAILLSACAPEPNLTDPGLPRLERPSEVLFWSQAEREAGFRAMERITPHRTVSAGGEGRALPPGDPLDLDVDGFMQARGRRAPLRMRMTRISRSNQENGFFHKGVLRR